ncbi:hypothetical protein KFL_005700090 [Klebsormidium nitens]|uniref:Uncharacterized protein n=1 Tax=Klebsormidium nitens TaxID=105231 RepID=A0A1Y1IMP2_KLENI|nr:hypothetical protein KFL_005700090 [Klebsormidium nitens]|eukprot:GAQ89867.1 hypothetical protein KFL_005700090 [Klebsormidium nitens]
MPCSDSLGPLAELRRKPTTPRSGDYSNATYERGGQDDQASLRQKQEFHSHAQARDRTVKDSRDENMWRNTSHFDVETIELGSNRRAPTTIAVSRRLDETPEMAMPVRREKPRTQMDGRTAARLPRITECLQGETDTIPLEISEPDYRTR